MTRGTRTTWVFGVAGLLMASVGLVGAQMMRADARHPSDDRHLTQAQYDAAVRVARHQVRQLHPRLTSASAIVTPGTVTQPNMAGSCTSGSVVKIRLIGHDFDVANAGLAGAKSKSVTSVEITADPTSGRPCLLSVDTGRPARPYRDGDDLLPALAG
jgi:hypothetical protein